MRTLLECYKILEEYPNGMTKDQFYRVARINKQHAKYLLDSGLVPCINTGKKTRKYHIATHDVITYLCDREDHPEKYKVPTGFYIGKNGCSKRHPDKPAAEIIRFNFTEPEKTGLYTMWEKLTAGYPEYRKARKEMQELVRAQKNVERFFAEEKDTTEKTQTR